MNPPLVSSVHTVTVRDLGSGGEGIAALGEAYTVFVPFALEGETVRIRVNHVRRNLVFADLLSVEVPSPLRVRPVCYRFGKCGGCDLMHVSYDAQLLAKHKALTVTLAKAGITAPVDPVVPSPEPLGYRNKLQLPFGIVEGRTVLGFFQEKTHRVVPIKKCFLHKEWAETLIAVTLEFVKEKGYTVYDERTGKGLLRHLVARMLQGALCVTLVVNGTPPKDLKQLHTALKERFDSVSLWVSVNRNRNNVIFGDPPVPVVYERQTVTEEGIALELHPLSFFQVNDGVRSLLTQAVSRAIPPSAPVIDAYSGVGLLGAVLAKNGHPIVNIEIVPEAIADAEKLYRDNGVAQNATHIAGDAAAELPKVLAELKASAVPPVIVLDPPRKGLDSAVVSTLNALTGSNLIYISCNPATLARDLNLLSAHYTVTRITPFDMFPMTKHVETLVLLSHKEPDSHISVNIEFGEGEGKLSLKEVEKRAEARKPKEKVTYTRPE